MTSGLSPRVRRAALFASAWILIQVFGVAQGPATAVGDSRPATIRSLQGPWRLTLDREDRGVEERWFEREFSDRIELPGSLPAHGLGDPVTVDTKWIGGIVDRSFFTAPEFARYREPGNVKVPFWLQPETYYAGVAWYQREVEIPQAWRDKRVVLFLERPHWETRVWLDDRFLGSNDSLSTPHEHQLGVDLPAGKHRLTIRVDNRMVMDIGENSHSISDHTQGNWNGIVGRIELRATPPVWIDDLVIHAERATGKVRMSGRLGNASGVAGQGTVLVRVDESVERGTLMPPPMARTPVTWGPEGGAFVCEWRLDSVRPWDEFNPQRYYALAWIEGHQAVTDAAVVAFGFRDLATEGTQFTVNGRRTFLRGTLECSIFPKTGHPPTDVESWRKVIRAAKAHGLNNLRFHSHCPPEAAFAAADELGLYLHVECGTWPNQSTTLGDGKPVDEWLYREAGRILKYYGNHPSFVMMLAGNEPGGDKHVAYLKQWVAHWKAKDPRRLYSSGAGWPQIPENQFHVTPDPRIQGWGQGLASRINGRPPETTTDYRAYIAARQLPVVSHEIGQWCVYPNFDEIPKYTGYLKPRNFEIFRESLAAQGMLDQARDFLFASGKLQALCYKEDIESALRTPGMAGFQLLDLHDFPGQGTALVGVLDPFWEEKGYVTPAEFSRFCDATVPLARLPKRVFTADETLSADLEVAHFGPAPLTGVTSSFKLVGDDGQVRIEGQLGARDVPVGNGTSLGRLNCDLSSLPAPARYRMVVSLTGSARGPRAESGAQGTARPTLDGRSRVTEPVENDWDIWVYPARVTADLPTGITLVRDLDESAVSVLEGGGKVLWLLAPDRVAPDPQRGRVALGFSSIFWNTAWTGGQAPHTLGILCDPKHPLFASFPTDAHSNWQWWYLIHRAGAMILDGLPGQARPVVQVIDDWVTNRKLGLVVECRVGKGRLAVCSLDLENGLETDPVRRQFRRSLFDYLAGDRFQPAVEASVEQVRTLAAAPGAMTRLKARAHGSSEQPGYEAAMAIDGNPRTMWHTAWGEPPLGFPHELVVQWAEPLEVSGLRLLPRQDGQNHGWIREYRVEVSSDGATWEGPVAAGTLADGAAFKRVAFDRPVKARGLKLVALSGYARGPWASVAEFELVAAEPAHR